MSVSNRGGERCTFGLVKDGDFSLEDLPAISSPFEIDTSNYVEIAIGSFNNNFLVCYGDDASDATTVLTAKSAVIKVSGGNTAKIPVAGGTAKLYVAAETGGPHTDDLQIVKTRGS